MKRRQSILILVMCWLSELSFGLGSPIKISEVIAHPNFETKTFTYTVNYANNFAGTTTSMTGDGPTLFIAVNALLRGKYIGNPGQVQEISKEDLAILKKASFLLPDREKESVGLAIKKYLQTGERPELVLNAALDAISTALKKNEMQYESSAIGDSDETKEKRARLKKLNEKIEAMVRVTPESEMDDDEKKLFERYSSEKQTLESRIKEAKAEKQVTKGKEKVGVFAIAKFSNDDRATTILQNDKESVDELLQICDTHLKMHLLWLERASKARGGTPSPSTHSR